MSDQRAATPKGELESQIMNPNVPKNEREWWASREIEALRRELAGLKEYAAEKSNQHIAMLRENQELRKALEDILTPVAAARRDLKPDERLSGDAYNILNSVANLREIARRALTMSDIHREQLDRPADKETP